MVARAGPAAARCWRHRRHGCGRVILARSTFGVISTGDVSIGMTKNVLQVGATGQSTIFQDAGASATVIAGGGVVGVSVSSGRRLSELALPPMVRPRRRLSCVAPLMADIDSNGQINEGVVAEDDHCD